MPRFPHVQPHVNGGCAKRVHGAGTISVQPKTFRIEQTFARPRAASAHEHRNVADDSALKRELAHIHDLIAAQKRALAALIGDGKERRMTRAAGELGAAIDGMEQATHRIMKSAEGIDDHARALAAALKSGHDRALALDIQDHVVQLFEACNFQDLAGQRIGKVISMLGGIEQQLAAMLSQFGGVNSAAGAVKPADGLINGPKLDGDAGHASQSDIDALFD
jgi:chemotaxis protein CheZ